MLPSDLYVSIQPNKIIFKPRALYKIMGLLFFVMIIAISFIMLKGYAIMALPYISLVALAGGLLLFLIGFRKIIIDEMERVIYVQSFVGKKKVFDLDEVQLMYVNDVSFGTSVNGYFKLTPKENSYVKGLKLHPNIGRNTKYYKPLEEAINKLRSWLDESPAMTSITLNPVVPIGRYFIQKGDVYVSKKFKFFTLFMSILFIAFAVYIILNMELKSIKEYLYIIVFSFLGIYYFGLWNSQVKIDLRNKKIAVTGFFGINTKMFPFADLANITTIRHLYLNLHNGTDIVLQLKNNKQIVAFSRIWKAKKIKEIIDESKAIIEMT